MIMESSNPRLIEPIGVLGYGVEGRSTCGYLLERGFKDITIFDRAAPAGLDPRLKYAGAGSGPHGYLQGLPSMRTVFRSAGVRADLPGIPEFLARGGCLTSQVGLAFALAGRDRIIGVTGTVGKGTCCSILHAMLTGAGVKVRLGGNIGVPALDLAASLQPDEWLLLELSSFQLSALPVSPRVAVVLRTTTEHLDWHPTREEYWLHKGNIAARQGAGDLLVHCADAPGSAWIAARGAARKIAFGAAPGAPTEPARPEGPGHTEPGQAGPGSGRPGHAGPGAAAPDILLTRESLSWVTRGFTLALAETPLKGAFNLENLAAAAAVALELGASPEAVRAAASKFGGLEHRLEFVREWRGLAFYNDSYATRPEAAMGAVEALRDAPLGLILGGSEKHADFGELAAAVAAAGHVKAVALIGQTASRILAELERAGAVGGAAPDGSPGLTRPGSAGPAIRILPTLEEALHFLIEQLGPGVEGDAARGAVALSPACASFGMFENYKERGKAFKRLVQGLR
jgi:UDP-N-acetylmuramoylalanine--D-glutamate ligase